MKKIRNLLTESSKAIIFIVATIIWSLFVYLIDGEWLYFVPLIAGDILFWETISWQFWKKKEKKTKKKKSEVRSWFDAIIFAVIAATILRTFLIEAYTIPTSSMEKSMLVGDFLFVSKVAYGPRVPMTPVAFPLVHHTMPIFGGKSYSEIIKIPYHRMKGIGSIKRNDCVVFNWPAETLGRPIDKKENYVKRCVGMPGDIIELKSSNLFINESPQDEFDGMKKQWQYNVTTKGTGLNPNILLKKYDITEGGYGRNKNEYNLTLTNFNRDAIRSFANVTKVEKRVEKEGQYSDYIFPQNKGFNWNIDNFGPISIPAQGETIQLSIINIPLYKDIIQRYEGNSLEIVGPTKSQFDQWEKLFQNTFLKSNMEFLKENSRLDDETNQLFLTYNERTIDALEKVSKKIKTESQKKNSININREFKPQIAINGEISTSYTFQMNYYWMMGDNRHNSADSRFWGFVPENHIVGKALFVWMSWDKNANGLKKIRWNRLFTSVK